jgi:hypothetical protein
MAASLLSLRSADVNRIRTLLVLLACLAAAAALVACGDDSSGNSVDENTDANTVLDRTFSGDQQIESADIDLVFDFAVHGAQSSNFKAEVTGPIDSSGDGIPHFRLNGKITGTSPARDLNQTAGAISTGDAAYVTYKGVTYKTDPQTFSFLQTAFEQSAAASGNTQGDTPQGLPAIRDFLTNVSNEGTEDVAGVESVHVSGAVDIDGLIKKIRPLAAGASALGIGTPGQIPTPAELDGLGRLVKSAKFDVWSGAEDNLLRRFSAVIDLDQPGGAGTAQLKFDITLANVNEDQVIEAPAHAKPLSELLDKLGIGGLNFGGLSGLGGGSGLPLVPGGGSGSGDTGSGGGDTSGGGGGATVPGGINPNLPQSLPQVPSQEQAQKYIDCLEHVVTAEDLQRCQDLLR